MSVPKPVIFPVTKKRKKNLFTTVEYTCYGLRSADGSREIIPPEHTVLYETGSLYFATNRFFDSEGRKLVLYRFREGMEGGRVSPETTLAYCDTLRNSPQFCGCFAAVQTWEKGHPWHVIDTAGRVVLHHLDIKPDIWENGFFSIRKGSACAIVDHRGRCVMRFPDPKPIADWPDNEFHFSGYSSGEFRISEYKVRGDNAMEAFTQYLDRFKTDCGLCLIATQNVQDHAHEDDPFYSCSYAFAPPPYSQPCLYLDAEIYNDFIFFSLRAPAEAPPPYQPFERLMLDADRISTMDLYGHMSFLPADVDPEAPRRADSDERSPDDDDPYGGMSHVLLP